MRKGRILTAVGTVVVLVGIYVIAGAVLPANDSSRVTIPAGDWYYVFSFGGLMDGSAEMDFIVADGAVRVYVFDSEQYAEYQETGVASYMYTTSGDSGSFTVAFPDSGKYYIVLEHGAMSGALDQDVSVETTINGVAITGLAVGLATVVLGVLLAVYGVKIGKREAAQAPTGPSVTDVTFLQDGRQSPPGQV